MKRCLFCNKIIKNLNKNKKYCNEVCSNSYRQLQKEQSCLDCNFKFKHHIKRKYCDNCKNKNRTLTVLKNCKFCELEYEDSTRGGFRSFCSETCGNSYRRLQKEQICLDCKIKFKHHVKRKYCNKCVNKNRKVPLKKKCLWCKKELINKNYCDSNCHYKYNKQKYIDKAKDWKSKNPEKVLKGNRIYKNKKYHEDPFYRINSNLRNHLRVTLKRYTLTGKIKTTKEYGISLKRIIKKFEKDAGFSFSEYPSRAIEYLSVREIDHVVAIHKLFEINKTYDITSKEFLEKIKKLYLARNLKLLKINVHRDKSSKENSLHQKLVSYLKNKEEIVIREISKEDAELMVNHFHYSDVMPRATKFYLGGFLNDVLIGIMTLGWGVQPERTIKKMFKSLNQKSYFEIGKLCLDERLPKNSGSKFISSCFKHINQEYPHIKLIFSWADGLLGKPGYIYQASNFLYGGSIWSKRYFTKEGYKIHPRSSRYLCEDNTKIEGLSKISWLTPSYMKLKNISLYQGLQFRYCYFLCSNIEKNKLIKESSFNWGLSYPKMEDLKWKVKKSKGYVDCGKPHYYKSLTARETFKLLIV